MAGLFDFLNSPEAIPEEVKQRRAQDWKKSTTKAGDAEMRARAKGVDLAQSRAMGAGQATAEAQAAKRADVLAREAWTRSAGAATAKEAGGLLAQGAKGAARGLLGPGALMLESGEVQAAELTPEQREAKNPGERADAEAYAQRVQGNARDAMGAYQPQALPGINQNNGNADMDSPEAQAMAQMALQEQQPPQPTPEQAKEIQAVQKAQAERQTEATRQTLERGTLEGLKSGKTSVSELATGVVQADAQRSGVEMTPEEQKKAVTAEIQTLKTMPKSDMARYVSYALVAGGLLAAALDKSGKAGDAFSNSFNRQLDRNLEAGKMSLQAQQAARKAEQEDRKIATTEKDVDSKVDDRKSNQGFREKTLMQGDRKIDIAEESLGVDKFKANTAASQGAQKIGLMASGQETTRRGQDLQFQLGQDRISAANTRADKKLKAAGSADKGVPMSYKDSKEIVGEVYKAQGLKADDSVSTAIASRLPTLQKKYPQMSAAELVELAQGEMQVTQDPAWIGKDTVRVRKAKE